MRFTIPAPVWLAFLLGFAAQPLHAQFQFDTKALLEDYSSEMFSMNAQGFMQPLVIVTNVGANDAFYNSARVPKENRLYVDVSIRSMWAFVRDDERMYTAYLPLEPTENPYAVGSTEWMRVVQLNYFKSLLRQAEADGAVNSSVQTATVFGGEGATFTIPKEWLQTNVPGIDSATIARLPNQLPLTSGTNQNTVFAAVPQVTVGALYSTELALRYIPPIVFDENVGKVMFLGVAAKHGFSNWIEDCPVDAAVQVAYQYTTIRNEVGVTKAKLEANTNLFAANLQVSRRWEWIEPYAGVSYETLSSEGSYTFTLPQNIVDEIGYDIDPQKVGITMSDASWKATLGLTAHAGPVQIFASAGFAKHLIFSAGVGYRFDTDIALFE